MAAMDLGVAAAPIMAGPLTLQSISGRRRMVERRSSGTGRPSD